MSAPAAEKFARTFVSLKSRNYRLFIVGQLFSTSGNWLTNVAITLYVLDRTGSGGAIGWLAACQYGPILLLSIWAGSLADRLDKRKLLFWTQSLEMAESAALAVLAFLPHSPLEGVYIVAVAGGCLLAVDNPTRRSFVRETVPIEQLPNAIILYSSMANLARIIGPAVAGVLVTTLGFGWAFALDSVSYVLVIAALVAIRGSELLTPPHPVKGRRQISAGIRYVLATPELTVSFGMLLVIGMLSYNVNVTLPILVEKALGGSTLQYTLLYSSFSLGALIGTFLVARSSVITLRTIVLNAGAFGVALTGMALVPGVEVGFVVAPVVGGTSIAYMTATTTLAQVRAEPQLGGRVVAVQTVLQLGTTPIGSPILGLIGDSAGGRAPVLVGGLAALTAFAVAAIASVRLRAAS